MPTFSKSSQDKLSTCHPFLQEICNELIKETDFTVLCGYRGEVDQNEAYNTGKSKAKWGQSKHNASPSKAVDIAPYPIDWNNHQGFKDLASKFKVIADHKNIKINWGGDFKNIVDLPHFELQ